MKKRYIAPKIKKALIYNEELLTVSGVTAVEIDIDYGGVDVDGALEPSANSSNKWETEVGIWNSK